MKVIFKTNIDAYKRGGFPENITQVPRIGEIVRITTGMQSYYSNQKLPIELKVVSVIWTDGGAICELHYRNIDIEYARLNGINLYP